MMRYARLLPVVLLILLIACAHRPDGPDSSLSAEEHLRLASIYESKGEIDLALRHFNRSIYKDAGNPGAHFALGNLYLKLGKYGGAERSYLKAVSIDPEKGVVYNNLGWLYMEMGDLNRAEAMAEEAVKREPAMRFVFLDTLGVIQTRAGKYEEAEKSFIEAVELIPADDTNGLLKVNNHLLDLYRTTGEEEKAGEIEKRLKASF